MRVWLIAASLWLVPAAASAQQSDADFLGSLGIKIVEPLSARELAATQRRIATELERSGSAALFEDVSDVNGHGKVRHHASGLVCPLGERGQRILVASPDQAVCERIADGVTYRTRVKRAPEGATLDNVAAQALSAMEQEPAYRAASGLSVTARPKPGSGRPEHRTFRFTSEASGRERASRVQIGLVRGWVLTERKDGPNQSGQQAMMADLMGEVTFGSSMTEQQ